MKKTLALILALMLILVTLVSCGGGEVETESQKESESESKTESTSESTSDTESTSGTESTSESESASETGSTSESESSTESASISTSLSKLDEHIKVVAEALNIRSSKDSSDDKNIVTYVIKDTVLHRVAIDGEWSKIIYNDKEAYVFSKYVVLTKTADDNYATGTVNVDAVNVRSSSSIESSDNILGTLKKGDSVSVVSLIDGWARVYYVNSASNYEGEAWIRATYLDIDNVDIDTDNGETESETTETGTESKESDTDTESETETETKTMGDILSEYKSKLSAYDSITASNYTVYVTQSMYGQTTATITQTVAKTNSTDFDDVFMAAYTDNLQGGTDLIDAMFIIAGDCLDIEGNEITEGILYDAHAMALLQGYDTNDYLQGFIIDLTKEDVKLAKLTNSGNKFMFMLDIAEVVDMYEQMGLNVNEADSYYKIECDFSNGALVSTVNMYIALNGQNAQPITMTECIVLNGLNADVQFPDVNG